jgi:lipid-A-disaccharide synthase
MPKHFKKEFFLFIKILIYYPVNFQFKNLGTRTIECFKRFMQLNLTIVNIKEYLIIFTNSIIENMEKIIFISAGDLSGDIHAANLMNALKALNPEIKFIGIGGNSMIEAGLESLIPLKDISVVGFWEVAKKYHIFRQLFKRCLDIMGKHKFVGFIAVDYPGFNIKLASEARQIGIPVVYYIAPQLWAWGANRAKNLSSVVDLLLAVFPFEVDFFSKFGIKAQYVGHPLLDLPDFDVQPINFVNREKNIVFLPGSRLQEIERHLPLINEIRALLIKSLPDYTFTVAKSPLIDPVLFSALLNDDWIITNDSRATMMKAAAGVIKTGTSTLEAALCGLPFTMFYKTSYISYLMGKNLIKLEYLSLPNILTGSAIVKEFIQKEATAAAISDEVVKIVQNADKWTNLYENLLSIKNLLGDQGASNRAAELIIRELKI